MAARGAVPSGGSSSRGMATSSTSDTPQHLHFLGGAAGGTIAGLVTCPLEVVKTRMQSSRSHFDYRGVYRGVFHALSTVAREEGVRGLWRGAGPTLIGTVPARSIYFGVYSYCKDRLSTFDEHGGESWWVPFFAAGAASCTASTLTNPLWVVKTRMQLQSSLPSHATDAGTHYRYSSTMAAIREIHAKEGFRGFMRGVSASYLGMSESALQFVVYERIKSYIRNTKLREADATETFFAGAGAKFIASLSTYPHEVLRTRLREQVPSAGPDGRIVSPGLVQCARTTIIEEGLRGLYGGLSAHLAYVHGGLSAHKRVVPQSAILFLTYETVLKFFS